MGAVLWKEQHDGWLSLDQTDFNQAMLEGERDGVTIKLALDLKIGDIDEFLASARKLVPVIDGSLNCPRLGAPMAVRGGVFELYGPSSDLFDLLHLRMRYWVNLEGPGRRKLRLFGFKAIENDRGSDMWSDTSTLFTRIYDGSWDLAHQANRNGEVGAPDEPDELDGSLVATAILQISPGGFLRELTTFRGTGGSPGKQLADILKYGKCFGEGLAKTYLGGPITDGRPSFPSDRLRDPWKRRPHTPDWHLVPGREEADPKAKRYALERDIVPFRVEDLPFALNLHHIRRAGEEANGEPVLLIPGSGVRAELFYGQPVGESFVDYLLATKKYDVWVESWRSSIDLPYNSYTLDQAARLDHPKAVETVLELTAKPKVRAVVHCQGSISFLLAAIAGFLPPDSLSHVVSSAISLFFVVPSETWLKQQTVLQAARLVGQGSDAQWGIRAPHPVAKAIAAFSRLSERPCGNVPCQVANYMYGSGWDVLLLHSNLDDKVHQWSARELGYTPFTLIQQVAESCRYGHIVPAQPREPEIPPSFLATKPQIDGARFTFIGGTHNRMFDPEGQLRSAEYLRDFGLEAGFVPLLGYGHLDTFWGRKSAADVFPIIAAGLEPAAKGGVTTQINPLPPERAPRFGAFRRDRNRLTFTPPPVARPRQRPPKPPPAAPPGGGGGSKGVQTPTGT